MIEIRESWDMDVGMRNWKCGERESERREPAVSRSPPPPGSSSARRSIFKVFQRGSSIPGSATGPLSFLAGTESSHCSPHISFYPFLPISSIITPSHNSPIHSSLSHFPLLLHLSLNHIFPIAPSHLSILGPSSPAGSILL